MTELAMWEDRLGTAINFAVNGAVATRIWEREARKASSYERLVTERVAPLVWLAMPVHDPTEGETR